MASEAGKGSKQRPTNQQNYSDNYERIFGSKPIPTKDDYANSQTGRLTQQPDQLPRPRIKQQEPAQT